MTGLPAIANQIEFARWRSEPRRWLPTVRAIARSRNLQATVLAAYETGTNLVVDLDGRTVLKLFPPFHRAQFVSERAALGQLTGRVSVPIPTIVAEGADECWSWLILTKLDGVVGSIVWPTVSESNKERLLEEIGRTIAEVQSVPLGEVSAIEPKWPQFFDRQVEDCITRHRRQGLAPRFLPDLVALLADAPHVIPVHTAPVILTGEWIPENLLLAQREEGWTLAGIIDFGDVLTGWREYDLLGPSTFMCAGVPSRVARLFRGYGMAPGACGPSMRRRLLTLLLLHRASDLRNIQIAGWETRIRQLFDLEDVIWPSGS